MLLLKYLKAHTEHVPERADTLAYTIDRHTLEAKARHLLTIAREALTYLSLALHIEEETRKQQRGDQRVVGILLTTYEDQWKR